MSRPPAKPLEAELLDWFADRFGNDPRLRIPLGDDAACLDFADRNSCILATDMLLEGVHFESSPAIAWELVGQKVVGVNLSDMAAMGARPLAVLISIALPRRTTTADIEQLYAGIARMAEEFDLVVAGGDTNVWKGPLVINVAVIGEPIGEESWTRSGGKPGDILAVTGPLGGSRLEKHWCAEPRVPTAVALAESGIDIHAAIDISDGLALDLSRLASASRCGAVLQARSIPVSAAAERVARATSNTSPLDHALADGEDFELLLALPQGELDRANRLAGPAAPLTPIGSLIEEPHLWLEDASGGRTQLVPRGYLHGV